MPKIKSEETVDAEKYYCTEKALLEGYYHVIDGKEIAIAKGEIKKVNLKGSTKKVPAYGSVVKYEEQIIGGRKQLVEVPTGKTYFEDLTPLQVHVLLVAGVIALTSEQVPVYKKWTHEVLFKK